MKSVSAIAHGKVNLHLGVGPLRPDGYHELVTVFQSLNLYDELTISSSPRDGEGIVASLKVYGNPEVPEDSSNLAWKAIEKLYDLHLASGGVKLPPVDIEIRKGIPAAGGMAGGSADAAAALRAFNEFLPKPASESELLEICAELGSDVPFTLIGGTQLGTGRGEKLTQVPSKGTYHWALAFSEEGLSTPLVFKTMDEMERTPTLEIEALRAALDTGDAHRLADALHNDMQDAALKLQPSLAHTLRKGEEAGALRAIVSGSGPTCAFLCADEVTAHKVASVFARSAVAQGPATGAHIKD